MGQESRARLLTFIRALDSAHGYDARRELWLQAVDDSQFESDIRDALGDCPTDPWNPDPDDPFWMLEIRQGLDDVGSWLKNERTFLTTRDAVKALRYPSRFEADCARRRLPSSESHRFEPTEHKWLAQDA